jgi:hypothetical protein
MNGFTYSGPDNGQDVWYNWRESARRFFDDCGLSVSSYFSDCSSISQISDPDFVFYYALAHGDYNSYVCEPGKSCTSDNVQDYLKDRGRMGFAFCGHCWSHVKTGSGTFSYCFRKGKTDGTVTIGYYKADESEGWRFSLQWQEQLFSYLKDGLTFGEAFEEATADYPEIAEMVRFVGDTSLTLEGAKQKREKEVVEKKGCLLSLLPVK